MGFEPSQTDSLKQTADDLEKVSTGDFAELSLKKEKAKLEVLASSDEDSSKPSTSTKNNITNGNSNIQEADDDLNSVHELDSSNDEASSPKKITTPKGKSSKSSKRESVKIKLFGKNKKSTSKGESSESEQETEDQPKKNKKLSKSEQLFRNRNKFEGKDSDSKGTDSIINEVTESQDNDDEEKRRE